MSLLESIRKLFVAPVVVGGTSTLPHEVLNYASTSYPSNHTFDITNGKLIPKRKLKKRIKTLARLYPRTLKSLLDIGCSKGYFVFHAQEQGTCERALGIDITDKEIKFCNEVKTYLQADKSRFELLRLDELGGRVNEFGGPFQTVLVVNLYQYLFFGSDQFSGCYLNHDMIFKYLSDVCSERVIFNNRIDLADCQNQTWVQQAGEKGQLYTEKNVLAAASNYFSVKPQGVYGRYPLWVLDKK
jgi:SAM-dependent methyltransferase